MSGEASKLKVLNHRFVQGHRGLLQKQGKVFKQWRSRYFVVEKRRLKSFGDDSLATPLGELIVDDSLQLYDVSEEVEGHRHLFYLVGKTPAGAEELLFVSASSAQDKADWIEAISDAVHDGFKQIFQPDLWSGAFYPTVDVVIQYSGVSVNIGELKPAMVIQRPEVTLRGVGPDEKFSFIMLDTDPVSSFDNPNRSKSDNFMLHWGVMNFNGSDINTGEELAPYIPPAPPYNSGLHRFFFLLFKQRTNISQILLTELSEIFLNREGFAFRKWVSLMNFGDPVAINGFYMGWDDYCDTIHKKMNYLPPEAFRSPYQEQSTGRETERIRIEKAKLELFRDLKLKDIFQCELDKISPPEVESMSINITFPNNHRVRNGDILSVQDTQSAPKVSYDGALSGEYFTLIMSDPDAPSRVNPKMREFVHWAVVNIPGKDVVKGTELLPYMGPAPPYSSGLHRYVFCLYKQSALLSETEVASAKSFFSKRQGIKTYEWITSLKKQFSSFPIAIEAFLAKWDSLVDDIHERMNWVPPAPYLSPKQLFAKEKDFLVPGTSLPANTMLPRHILNSKIEDACSEKLSVLVRKFQGLGNDMNIALASERSAHEKKEHLLTVAPGMKHLPVIIPSVSISAQEIKFDELFQPKLSPAVNKNIEALLKIPILDLPANFGDEVYTGEIDPVEEYLDPMDGIACGIAEQSGKLPETVRTSLRRSDPQRLSRELSAKGKRLPPAPKVDSNDEVETQSDSQSIASDGKRPSVRSSITSMFKKSLQRTLSMTTAGEKSATPKKNAVTADDLDQMLQAGFVSSSVKASVSDDDFEDFNSTNRKGNQPPPLNVALDVDTTRPRSLNLSTSPRKLGSAQSQFSASFYGVDGSANKKIVKSSSLYNKPLDDETNLTTQFDRTKNTVELCREFDITSPTVFEGEVIKKKFSADFMAKDSFVWIDTACKSLHWAKSLAEKATSPGSSKFIYLIRENGMTKSPLGEGKGVLKSIEQNGLIINIGLESGDMLELKITESGSPAGAKRVLDWVKVLRTYLK